VSHLTADLGVAEQRITLSVVVMAYNEADSLAPTVREIDGVLSSLRLPHEIVIIDDGSRDGTGEVAEQIQSDLRAVRVIHHDKNRGLGGVYRTGFSTARGEFVTFFPADGQFPASILRQFIPEINECDLVLGYLPSRRDSPVSRVLSWSERRLYEIFFGRLPRFQGVLMFRRILLEHFALRSKGRGWGVLMEFIIRVQRSGGRTKSVPTSFRPRVSGRSKVNNWRTIYANLMEVWALRRCLTTVDGEAALESHVTDARQRRSPVT
jgi:glycosyltransferase involved in cell wall biosynthesis